MRQGVILVGLSSPMFEQALEAVEEIYDVFNRAIAEGQLEENDLISRVEEHALHASNRIFTPKKEASDGTRKLQIPQEIDPRGILKAIADEGGYVYTEDNVVEYYVRKADETGKMR